MRDRSHCDCHALTVKPSFCTIKVAMYSPLHMKMNSGISRSLSSISAIPDLVFRAERAPWLVTPPPRPTERDLAAGKGGNRSKAGSEGICVAFSSGN